MNEERIERRTRCQDCGREFRTYWLPPNPAEVLDAFYSAIPEQFGSCLRNDKGERRHGSAAASIPLAEGDKMWLTGIAAAIEVVLKPIACPVDGGPLREIREGH